MLAGCAALKEVAEDPSSGLVLWQQESLLLLLDCLLHEVRPPVELQEEARNNGDVTDVSTANQEEYDIHSSYTLILPWDPAHPKIELVLGLEAPGADLFIDHLREVNQKVQEQVQSINLFKAHRLEKKEKLREHATAVHPQ